MSQGGLKRKPVVLLADDDPEDQELTRRAFEEGDVPVIEVASRFEDAGVAALVYTDIERDGMLTGPNLEETAALADGVSIPVIVSGGVGDLDDLLRAASYADRGIAGVIVGRALYTGAVSLGPALERLEGGAC